MRNQLIQTALIVIAASLLTAATALARFPGMSSHTQSGEIDLMYSSKIANGPTLKPGNYKVELAQNEQSPEVMFYQDGKLVGQAPAKLVSQTKKIEQTEVQYNTVGDEHVITEIDLHGWRQEVKFTPSGNAPAGS